MDSVSPSDPFQNTRPVSLAVSVHVRDVSCLVSSRVSLSLRTH